MSFKIIAADLMSTKHGFMPASVLPILTAGQSISKLAFLPFQRDYKSCVTGLLNITVPMSVWNQPASTGSVRFLPVFPAVSVSFLPGYRVSAGICTGWAA